MVANERLRLENEELRRRAGRNDPRVERLEAEVARLRSLVEQVRAERDELREGIEQALARLRSEIGGPGRAGPRRRWPPEP